MSETTFERRLQQLITDVMQHPHSEELLRLTQEQLQDDTFVLVAKDA
jgi:hypothetical protein